MRLGLVIFEWLGRLLGYGWDISRRRGAGPAKMSAQVSAATEVEVAASASEGPLSGLG